MGMFNTLLSGLFSKKPTAAEKKEINSILSRVTTCAKRLESTDSIDRYITEWDKYSADYERLRYYEDKKIKFTVSPQKIHEAICAEVPRIEKDVVTRGYDRMLRDAAKLSTSKGKQNRAEKYFNELAFYYSRLQPETVNLIEQLKNSTTF